MKNSLFAKTFAALILSSFLVLSAGTANAKRLTAAVADWTGGEITCQVAVAILEEELGYRVDRIEFASGTGLWEAIAAGDIDFACESWPSYAEADDVMLNTNLIYDGEVVKEYSGDGSVDAYTSGIIGMSDYYVPKYFVDANPDFKDWRDLNKYKDIDLLQVDAEGYDDEVIYNSNIELFQPKYINFEYKNLTKLSFHSNKWRNYSTIVTWYLWSSYDSEPLYL